MSVLDRLEAGFTRDHDPKPCGRFAARLQPLNEWLRSRLPDRHLESTDYYSFSLCLRRALGTVAPLILAYTAFWVVGIICIGISLWHSYPELFHFGRWETRVWHSLWRLLLRGFVKKFILLPFVPVFWVLFSLLLSLPRMFFWNRRAKRLHRTGKVLPLTQITQATCIVDAAQTDAFVWPPPPKADH